MRAQRARLPRYSLDEIVHLVDELLELGFLEVVEAGEHHDLDFTGEFSIPDLKKAAR